MPKSAPKLQRVWPEFRPDLDKLCRACLNSLTGIAWRDGSQGVRLEAEKDYGAPGVVIWVEPVVGGRALLGISLTPRPYRMRHA
ncbi:MAG TPA: RusA family crossover junction endodeoxyribonuclease [Thermoplasmata archaeon]|nr:RusA family crossover junction endodeoxyribonuclease [Thermoplasmata archaeon]